MEFITVRGNDYQMGYQIGAYFSSYLKSAILPYIEKIKDAKILHLVLELEARLKEEFPDGLEEIKGRADGAAIPRDATLLMFFPEILERTEGCTTVFLRKPDGQLLFSHNEDDKEFTPENTALIKYDYGSFWVVGYTNAEKLLGSSFAFNSAGMLFSTNYIYPETTKLEYISRYVLSRKLMNAKSIPEVKALLQHMRVASPFSLNVINKNTLEAYNFEKNNETYDTKEVTDRYGRANHFILHPYPDAKERVSSYFRTNYVQEKIRTINAETAQLQDVKGILDYAEEDYYRCVYKEPTKFEKFSVTVANFSYDSANDEIEICDYLTKTCIKKGYSEFE